MPKKVSYDFTPEQSSSIRSVDYNPVTQTLTVRFRKDNRTVEYYNVPSDIFQDFMGASSIGQYFNYHIRDNYQNKEV